MAVAIIAFRFNEENRTSEAGLTVSNEIQVDDVVSENGRKRSLSTVSSTDCIEVHSSKMETEAKRKSI